MNRRLYPETETLLLPPDPAWRDLSASAVREIAAFGGDIRGLVPGGVYRDIMKWLNAPAVRP